MQRGMTFSCGIIHLLLLCTFAKLEARIEQGQWQVQSDAVKLCLLYMLNCVLIGAEERNYVPIWQLHLIDDLDAFNAFPWGSHVYKHSIFGFKKVILSRPMRYNLYGLAYAILVFAFEVIPTLATKFLTPRVVEQPLSRILKWDLTQGLRGDKLDKIFTAKMYAEEQLVSTEAHRVIWYYLGLMSSVDAASSSVHAPAAQNSVSNALIRPTRVRLVHHAASSVGADSTYSEHACGGTLSHTGRPSPVREKSDEERRSQHQELVRLISSLQGRSSKICTDESIRVMAQQDIGTQSVTDTAYVQTVEPAHLETTSVVSHTESTLQHVDAAIYWWIESSEHRKYR
ncbi:hypothetical protein Dsin_022338 [Dipteronia sinensis]|uniref:DUF1985 domain-containing protein n=1 Tax=Dipteronia sinensis TaxID=43782 RepID=A0AAE0DZP5_9ROSI|nr:hypothetical protein Dsin_022338 [Dipteronia sinensis]